MVNALPSEPMNSSSTASPGSDQMSSTMGPANPTMPTNSVPPGDYAPPAAQPSQPETAPPIPGVVPMAAPLSTNNQPPTEKTPPPRGGKISRILLGVLVLILLVLGGSAGYYLSMTNQDIRQEASGGIRCGDITCTDGRWAGKDCNAPQATCQKRAEDFCGVGQVQNMGTPPTPEECSGGGVPQCSECTSNCGATGCGFTCPPGLNPQDDCNLWESRFMCEGQRNDGCNEITGSPVGAVDYTNSEYWCKTYQFDSNHWSGNYSVVWVGNNGQVCVEGTGCNPNNLDWNCNAVVPTATMTAACQPATQTIGNLNYRINVASINPAPSDAYADNRIEYWMCLSNNNANHSVIINQFFGGNASWIGGNAYCYKLKSNYLTAGATTNFLDFNSNVPIGEGAAWAKNINQLATFVKTTFPTSYQNINFPVKGNMMINGVWSDQLFGPNIKIYPEVCAPATTPSPTPSPTPTPTPTPTPSPTPTPTPTPPPIGPMCLSISMAAPQNPPVIGDSVNFTCAQITLPGTWLYQFRVIEPGGTIKPLATSTSGSTPHNTSAAYQITKQGAFEAQCRICNTDSSLCSDEWN
jgi:hypothetical protein